MKFIATVSFEGGETAKWEVQANDAIHAEALVNEDINNEPTLKEAGAWLEQLEVCLLFPRRRRPVNTNIDDYYTD